MKRFNKMASYAAIAVLTILIFVIPAYAIWYSNMRESRIVNNEECDKRLSQPQKTQMMPAPGGQLAPVVIQELCMYRVVPPRLGDLMRGRFVFEMIPSHMRVTPYSLKEIITGNYQLTIGLLSCDPSATTTRCLNIPVLNLPPL